MKLREEVRPHYEIAEKARIDGLPPAEAAKEVWRNNFNPKWILKEYIRHI